MDRVRVRLEIGIWVLGIAAAIATSACSGDEGGLRDGGVEPDGGMVCTPEAESTCLGHAVADVDSCGNPGALTEVCPCGCTPDERACSAFTEPDVGPADDPACVVRTECFTIERVVCEPRADGKWLTETRYENGCAEAVRCAGYGIEALWEAVGLARTCYSLNGATWGPGQTGYLARAIYDTLEDCELAFAVAGPRDHACVTYDSPETCLPPGMECERFCP